MPLSDMLTNMPPESVRGSPNYKAIVEACTSSDYFGDLSTVLRKSLCHNSNFIMQLRAPPTCHIDSLLGAGRFLGLIPFTLFNIRIQAMCTPMRFNIIFFCAHV